MLKLAARRAKMDGPKLHVVLYRPCYGNFQHWALYLDADDQDVIFKVIGSHPDFRPNVMHSRPEYPKNFVGKVCVAILAKTIFKEYTLSSVRPLWIMTLLDILDKLQDEFILEEDDEEYRVARKEMKENRGAIL